MVRSRAHDTTNNNIGSQMEKKKQMHTEKVARRDNNSNTSSDSMSMEMKSEGNATVFSNLETSTSPSPRQKLVN